MHVFTLMGSHRCTYCSDIFCNENKIMHKLEQDSLIFKDFHISLTFEHLYMYSIMNSSVNITYRWCFTNAIIVN